MKIVWRLRAERELARQLAYLAVVNAYASERMRDRIDERMASLIQFPNSDRPSRREGVRELVISGTPYVAGVSGAG